MPVAGRPGAARPNTTAGAELVPQNQTQTEKVTSPREGNFPKQDYKPKLPGQMLSVVQFPSALHHSLLPKDVTIMPSYR